MTPSAGTNWRSEATMCVGIPAGIFTRGPDLSIRLAYRGNVISDAGNGVYFVGIAGSGIPHLEGMAQFAQFDTTFHWPRKLRFLATGQKVEERRRRRPAHGPLAVGRTAVLDGFNLGDYSIENIEAVEGVKIQMATEFRRSKVPSPTRPSAITRGPITDAPMRPNRRCVPR